MTVAEDSRERKLIYYWDNVELARDRADWDNPANASVNPNATSVNLVDDVLPSSSTASAFTSTRRKENQLEQSSTKISLQSHLVAYPIEKCPTRCSKRATCGARLLLLPAALTAVAFCPTMRRIFAYFSLALILGVQLIRAGNYYNDDSLSVTCYVGYSEIPCYNGASCKSYSSQCLCAKGFTGRNCQKNIDECKDADCGHGVCEDGIGTYTCKCDQGYTGEYCDEDFDECESNTHECQNGAECVNSPKGSYMCTCPKHEQYQYALFDGKLPFLDCNPCI
ncbi:hypothetical protein L596_016235 [Steinernema carpocapsae]|uniref:EGF-like domain-containing protein n=1 Tax=Steinernema carpocapsae TaxID=34508 RepID=A0A4U5NIK9_STECR|nr:hypothetical protein L596_016235 [Steinernema carpocapsae]